MMFLLRQIPILVRGCDIATARLQAIPAERQACFTMACDHCCYQEDIADEEHLPAGIGCFP